MGSFTVIRQDQNLVNLEAVIVAENENSDFPITNLATMPLSKPGVISKTVEQFILVDLLTAKAVSVAALCNHNLSSAAVITLRGGNSWNPDGTQFETTITWRKRDAFKIFTAQTFRFWAIEIDDPTNRDGFLRCGQLILAEATVTGIHFTYGWQFGRRYEANRAKAEFGTPHISHLYSEADLQWSFQNLTDAQADTIADLIDALNGDEQWVFILPTGDNTDAYFGRFTNGIEQIRSFRADESVSFTEDGPGRAVVRTTPFLYIAGQDLDILEAVFTRNSTARWVKYALQLEEAAVDEARDGHFATRSARALLLEATRANAWTRSEAITDAAWTKTNATVSGNATNAPDGDDTADKVVEDSTPTAAHGIERSVTGTDDEDQTVLIHAAPEERTWLYIETTSKAGTVKRSWVNLATGVLGTVASGHAVRIRAIANSFTLIAVTWDIESGGTTPKVFFGMATADANVTYSGDGASGLYLWGAQQESDAPFPSSYIPTEDATVTCADDTIYLPYEEAPKAITVYIRFIELGTIHIADACLFSVGSNAPSSSDDCFKIQSDGTFYEAILHSGGQTSQSTLGAAPSIGDTVELRLTIDEDGEATLHQTINEGAESAASGGGTVGLPENWEDERLYLNSWGEQDRGFSAITSVKIARGLQTLATMRGIVE